MDVFGVCRGCGRPREANASGAPVSCCPGAVRAPLRANDAAALVDGLVERLDRALVAVPGSGGPAVLVWIAAACYLLIVAALVLRGEIDSGASATGAPACVRGSRAPSAPPR